MTFDDPTWLEQERRWLSDFRRGDTKAFDRLFEAYAEPLYHRVLLPRLGDAAAAEDALSETFRRAFEGLASFEDRGKGLWPFLATVACNQAMDLHRQRGRAVRALAGFEALVAPLQAAAATPPLPDAARERRELQASVAEVLAALSPRYRRALTLRLFEDRSREECAAALEVKVPTFDVLLLRALRAFRERWQARENPPRE